LDFKSPSWQDIEKETSYIMEAKSIYITGSLDRYNLLTNLKTRLGIETKYQNKCVIDQDITTESYFSTNQQSDNEEIYSDFDDDQNTSNFTVDIP